MIGSRCLLLVPNRNLRQRENGRSEVELPRLEAFPAQILMLISNLLSVLTLEQA